MEMFARLTLKSSSSSLTCYYVGSDTARLQRRSKSAGVSHDVVGAGGRHGPAVIRGPRAKIAEHLIGHRNQERDHSSEECAGPAPLAVRASRRI